MLHINLQNRTAPAPSMCTAAIQALYGTNDACADAVRQLVTNATDTTAPFLIFSIPGCQDRLNNAVLQCDFDAVNNENDTNNGSSIIRIEVSDI